MAKKNKERPYPFQYPKSKGCKRMSMKDKISALPDDTLLTIFTLDIQGSGCHQHPFSKMAIVMDLPP
ncbi:hypothetical protein ES288_A06G107100v1 [Gossypium darwinii]|uniref:Uncharacterized protein n=1 Tax=Gossypium darwinii TaxID=34276 RepID=A0A5D2G596_GOSDA|nr:hypothetical protein ES288_A06G107100v1 [Gossypium darwinii]